MTDIQSNVRSSCRQMTIFRKSKHPKLFFFGRGTGIFKSWRIDNVPPCRYNDKFILFRQPLDIRSFLARKPCCI